GAVPAIPARVEEDAHGALPDPPPPVASRPDTPEARRPVAEATLGERNVNELGRQQGGTQRECRRGPEPEPREQRSGPPPAPARRHRGEERRFEQCEEPKGGKGAPRHVEHEEAASTRIPEERGQEAGGGEREPQTVLDRMPETAHETERAEKQDRQQNEPARRHPRLQRAAGPPGRASGKQGHNVGHAFAPEVIPDRERPLLADRD